LDWKNQPPPYKPPDCKAKHLKGLNLFQGHLYGYSGDYHREHPSDLNVWFIDSFMPYGLYVSGISDKHYAEIAKSTQHDLFLPISDQQAPADIQGLNDAIDIIFDYLKAGKNVAMSCHGGHGRTGTIMALLYGLTHPECDDPIEAVRKLGCDSWVESEKQAKFIFTYLNLPYLKKYDKPKFQTHYTFDKQGKLIIDAELKKELKNANPADRDFYTMYGAEDVWEM
jgi:hypothetical protein